MQEKVNILNLDMEELEKFILELGMKKFNAKQIFKWLHAKMARTFDDMTDISQENRIKLYENSYIPYLELLKHQVSKIDKTEKFLFQLADKHTIETVLLRHKDGRNTICVSTQVGCPLACVFCATGKGGFERNLDLSEILNQVYTIDRRMMKKESKITNIVFMGMGEPLLNYDNLIKSIHLFSHKDGLNISKRKITISTSGILPRIEQLIEEDIQVELAISLHSAIDSERSRIMPVNKKYSIDDLFLVLREYQRRTNRRIGFEYILIKDFNCAPSDAEALQHLLGGLDHILNLIPYNSTGTEMTRPSEKKIERFYEDLKYNKGLNVTIRKEKGTDIEGACGQLREKNK